MNNLREFRPILFISNMILTPCMQLAPLSRTVVIYTIVHTAVSNVDISVQNW